MSKLHGKNFAVYVDGVKIGDNTDCTITINQTLESVTSKDDDNWEALLASIRSATITADYLEDSTNTFSAEDAFDLILNASRVLVEFSQATASTVYWYAYCYAENVSLNAPMGAVTGSVSFKTDGAVSKATISAS